MIEISKDYNVRVKRTLMVKWRGKNARTYSMRCTMHLRKIIQFLVFAITSVGRLINTSVGKKIILICQVFHVFILLSWINNCYAYKDQAKPDFSYDKLMKKIASHKMHDIVYNPSKSAAIVNPRFESAVYINFKTKQTYIITAHEPGLIFSNWVNDTIATIETSCGTGCAKVIIFSAPATIVSCSDHEYRIENLNLAEPPDYYHNRPLLIDPKKGIYVCYDDVDNIQIFPLPKHPTIRPPKGFFTEQAKIRNNKLIVMYQNARGKIKQISYALVP